MSTSPQLTGLVPDNVFDGGDLDCGSGLILLIREAMRKVPVDGILEMRSREKTVSDDLPPWCRMSGHEYLGQLPGTGCTRYFVRKGKGGEAEEAALDEDKEKAKGYEWRLRARVTGHQQATVYTRNFSFQVGQAASFEEKDQHPSAVEYLFGALSGSLAGGFATECARDGIEVDDIEITIAGRLHNILAHLGIEEGDPSIAAIEIKCFASTFDDEGKVQAAWQRTVQRSPLAVTLGKSVSIKEKLVIV